MWMTPRPTHDVHVMQTGESYACAVDESLLRGMLRLGRKGIPVGCVNGGCGVCKGRVVEGGVKPLGPVSRAHVSVDEEAQGYTLACRVAPTAPVRLDICGRLVKPFTRPSPTAVATQAAAPVSPTNPTQEI